MLFSFVATLAMGLSCCWISCRKKSQKSTKLDDNNTDAESGLAAKPFFDSYGSLRSLSMRGIATFIDYKKLKKGTKSFHERKFLGKGGSGRVYKACFEDGSLAAVKKLDCLTLTAQRDFEMEVQLLSTCHHPHIVSLRGYSIDNDFSFVVYELMHNGSLDYHLHGPSRGSTLTWDTRLKIAFDVAKGLAYLHNECNPPIIHRDVKSSNILLDSEFNAKIGDFGLAVPLVEGQGIDDLQPAGTIGYAAPENILNGTLTKKADVYAFGVLLLELLFGRRPVEALGTRNESLLKWSRNLLNNMDVVRNIVDPVIRGKMDAAHLQKITWLAHLCTSEDPSCRPPISDVLDYLFPLVPTEP